MASNEELIIQALRDSISRRTSDYEMLIAELRVQITRLIEERDAKEKAVQEYSDSLNQSYNSKD